MASIRYLCAQLGFNSIPQFGIHPEHAIDIKYDATLLLEDSQEFVRKRVAKHGYPDLTEAAVRRNFYTDFVPIAHDFLNHNGFAQKYWPAGSASKPWHGPRWPEDTDLIEKLVARIIAHKMRNMKQRIAKAAENQPKSQPEDSSDLPRQNREDPLPSYITDLEDFDVAAASDMLTAELQDKDREKNSTMRKEVTEYQHSSSILSSIEDNDPQQLPEERRQNRQRQSSSPPWTWTNQLSTPSNNHDIIGTHSLRKRDRLKESAEARYTPERPSKLRKVRDDSQPSKRRSGRTIRPWHRLDSHRPGTYGSTAESVVPAESHAADALSSSVTGKSPPQQPAVAEPDITFHFFGSNPSLGAIPKPHTAVSSPNKFFGAAMEAWMLTGQARPRVKALSAVSVTWEGGKRPVMVPWHDAEGFQGMVSAVKKAEGKGAVEVEVRCIAQV